MEAFFNKILAFFMTIIMFLFPTLNIPDTEATVDDWNTEYTCVFVHGLGGWGVYDFANKVMPYWGVATGDMMKYLRARGFDVAAASVTPAGSAWDRACSFTHSLQVQELITEKHTQKNTVIPNTAQTIPEKH